MSPLMTVQRFFSNVLNSSDNHRKFKRKVTPTGARVKVLILLFQLLWLERLML